MLKRRYWQRQLLAYFLATAGVIVMTGLIYVFCADSIPNISMLYLLVVTFAALTLGRGAAVFCSVLSFLTFDWFFVDPKYQLTVQYPSEWLALCMFLLTATIIGQLTALLKTRMEEAQKSRTETAALAQASWLVASDIDRDRVLIKLLEAIGSVTDAEAIAMLLRTATNDEKEEWVYCAAPPTLPRDEISLEAVKIAIVQGKAVGWDESTLWSKALADVHQQGKAYLPITFENQTLGVICLKLKTGFIVRTNEKKVVDSLVNHAAVVLHRDELLQIQAQANALAEVDRLKTALLSMVSHDFRSPLTSIKANVGSLLQEDTTMDSQTQRATLQAVDEETDRLNRLVGNILDFSRLEAQAWATKKECTPVAELVGPVLASFDDAQNERIRLELDSTQDLWIDSVQMTQVLRNLIENSLKYSRGQITVRVNLEGKEIGIDVIDSGPGLPKGEEQDIFKPFYRAAAFRESSLPGMGMGLAVCKGLVEAHHGTLTASNRDEGGAIFHIAMPNEPSSPPPPRVIALRS